MIGALVGLRNIPSHMKHRILSFDCQKEGIIRDEFLSVKKHGVKNIQKLI